MRTITAEQFETVKSSLNVFEVYTSSTVFVSSEATVSELTNANVYKYYTVWLDGTIEVTD